MKMFGVGLKKIKILLNLTIDMYIQNIYYHNKKMELIK